MRVCALFYHPPPSPPPPPHPSSLLSGWVFVFVLASLPGGGGEVGGGSVGDGRARRGRFFTPPPHKRALTQLDGSARRSRTPRLDGYRWHRSQARKIPTSPRLRKSSIIAVGSLSVSISLSLSVALPSEFRMERPTPSRPHTVGRRVAGNIFISPAPSFSFLTGHTRIRSHYP